MNFEKFFSKISLTPNEDYFILNWYRSGNHGLAESEMELSSKNINYLTEYSEDEDARVLNESGIAWAKELSEETVNGINVK